MNRDKKLCENCIHKSGDYCVLVDTPTDMIVDDIMFEENSKIFKAMHIIAGGDGNIEMNRPKIDRKLDKSCIYILEHIVLNQKD